MGFRVGFGGKNFRVSVGGKRGTFVRVGNSKGISYSTHIGTGGKKHRATKTTQPAKHEWDSTDNTVMGWFSTIIAIPFTALGLLLSVLLFSDVKVVGYFGLAVLGLGVFCWNKGKKLRRKEGKK